MNFSSNLILNRILCALLLTGGTLHADESCHAGRADAHAPIGVMGEHTHNKGEWMLSYRFMFMDMDGNRSGTSSVSVNDYFTGPLANQFVVMPERMTMEMHMLGLMYAPSDNLTLMAMLNYATLEMDHVIGAGPLAGQEFTTVSDGVGDLPLSLIYNLKKSDHDQWLLNFGISLPTASINHRDDIPLPPPTQNRVLPYPMQLGSGTFDLLPGLTYLWKTDNWSGGAQAKGVIRLNENEENYALGNRLHLTTWLARNWNPSLSTSLRLEFQAWEDIRGADNRLPQNAPLPPLLPRRSVPTAIPDIRAGERIDLSFGINLHTERGPGTNQRLAIEIGAPIYQRLDGPQLGVDLITMIGWQMAF